MASTLSYWRTDQRRLHGGACGRVRGEDPRPTPGGSGQDDDMRKRAKAQERGQ